MKGLSVFIIAIFFGFTARCQFFNLELESYDSNEGLSQNHVFSVVQDKKGFIWVGTDDGLNRFDGHEFKVYKHDDDNPNTIVDNSIRALMADDSSIWIGTNEGMCRYYPETETVHHFPIDLHDPYKIHGSQIVAIAKHPDGRIWIGYLGTGVDIITPGKKEIAHYSIEEQSQDHRLQNNFVSAIQFMPDGDALLGTLNGVEVIDRSGKVLNQIETQKKYPWIKSLQTSIRSFLLTKDEKALWMGSELQGIYRLDLGNMQLTNFNKEKINRPEFNFVMAIHEDSRGNIWIGAEVIYFFDKQQDKPVPYFEYGIEGNTEIVNPIYSIFEDKDNNIWLGTYRYGVLKCNLNNNGILHYYSNHGQPSRRNEIFCFAEGNNGTIWVGTGQTGLFELRQDLKGFTPAPLSEKFPGKSIKCLFKDEAGYFWMGAWDAGLTRYHPQLKTIENFHPDKGTFGSRHVWDIKGDSAGNLWLGTLRDGLCYYNPRTGKSQYYRNIPGDSTSLINNDIMAMLIDSRQRLWVGSSDGLSVLLPGAKTFINFQKRENKKSLSTNLIYCFLEDKRGRIWIGTNGGGITIFNQEMKIDTIITEKNGLPSNSVASIQSDDDDNLWVSTYNGLAKINPENLTIEPVAQVSRMKIKEFIPKASFKSADGKLFFGGYNGFSLFHPDSLKLDPIHEKVVFTSLQIENHEITPGQLFEGRKILSHSITETNDLQLSYHDRSIVISFAPLTYNWQRSLRYAYFMENLDDDWQYTSADRRFVHYTNLTPGDYVLHVKASFDGKHWSENAKSMTIHVSPPWWGTFWFRTVAAVFFLLILYSAYRVRVRFLNAQKERLEYLVKQGTQEINNLLKEVAEKNEALQYVNEELMAQRDTLTERSNQLEQAQTKLKSINVTLEELVSKRTKKLNFTLHELETFLYRASHDLRGPISSMLGLIKVAAMENNADPINKTYTDFLTKTTIKLERTLQKLTQKHTIQKSKISNEIITRPALVKLLDETTRHLPVFRAEDFDVRVAADINFQTDPTMLNILMINLLENAFFFSERSSNRKVSIDVSQSDSVATISVTDNGPGIKEEVKDKIFTMFYRGHELSTGNGLGLYLVKSAVEKVKGQITLETEVGRYSRFTVTFPKVG